MVFARWRFLNTAYSEDDSDPSVDKSDDMLGWQISVSGHNRTDGGTSYLSAAMGMDKDMNVSAMGDTSGMNLEPSSTRRRG
jgi:hypothetical protein